MSTKNPVVTAEMLILQLGENRWTENSSSAECLQDLAVTKFSHVWSYDLYVLTLPPAGDKFQSNLKKSVCSL